MNICGSVTYYPAYNRVEGVRGREGQEGMGGRVGGGEEESKREREREDITIF